MLRVGERAQLVRALVTGVPLSGLDPATHIKTLDVMEYASVIPAPVRRDVQE